PLAALGVFTFAPDGRGSLDQVLLRRKELVVGREDRCTEPLGREIDELEEWPRHTRRPIGSARWIEPVRSGAASHTRSPRTNVVLTRPRKRRPAYGVSLWRCCSASASTVNSSSGSQTTRSASWPGAMRPFRSPSPARLAGASLIQRDRSLG